MSSLVPIASLTSHSLVFSQSAAKIGFGSVGEINRFIFNVYGRAIREIPLADRPRGWIFVLEPASIPDALGTPAGLKMLLEQIQLSTTKSFSSLRLDLVGGLSIAYTCTPEDRKSLTRSAWPQHVAQHLSRMASKCVVWVMGVRAIVFLCGDICLESADVIEQLPAGFPTSFQDLSWDDGAIMFAFADGDLNDTGPIGIWRIPNNHVLKPKPELLICSRLGRFLTTRLAGYSTHYEEAHVENEGRVDISLHLIDDSIYVVEVKWIGCSLIASREKEAEEAIKKGIIGAPEKWLTKFDDTTIRSGVRQLVRYFKGGKYHRAYLAAIDCSPPAAKTRSEYLPVSSADLDGHSEANFRVLRACVDPRSASKRGKSS